jgi:hypothetical protein
MEGRKVNKQDNQQISYSDKLSKKFLLKLSFYSLNFQEKKQQMKENPFLFENQINFVIEKSKEKSEKSDLQHDFCQIMHERYNQRVMILN